MANGAENYVVRIYRRDKKEPWYVAGLVELVEQERIETFKDAAELMRILGIDSGAAGKQPGTRRA